MSAGSRFVVPTLISALLAASMVVANPAPVLAMAEDTSWSPPPAENLPTIPDRETHDAWRPVGQEQARSEDASRFTAQSAPSGVQAAAPGVGERSWFAFEEFPLTSTSSARINVANGNLLVTSTDLTLAAPGTGLRHDRFYNGLSSAAGTMGGGWGYNASTEDIGLNVQATFADFHGPNGTVTRFALSNGVFSAPAGSNLSLKKIGSGDFAYTVTVNRSGEQWTFDVSGRLSRTTDRNGAGAYYALSGGQTVMVSPWGASRLTSQAYFSYEIEDGYSRPGAVVDSAGRRVAYTYDASSRLSKVTLPDGSSTTYSYDSSNRLSSITMPSAGTTSGTGRVTFGYDAAHRVVSVTRQSSSLTWGAAASEVTRFTYSAGSTRQTDPRGGQSTYAIDSLGRVTSTTNQLGHRQTQTWTPNSDVQTATDALTAANVTRYEFDGNNNAVRASLPTGAAATASYSVGGSCQAQNSGTAYQPKCATDASGNRFQYEYDAAGNLLRERDVTSATPTTVRSYGYENANSTLCNGIVGQICTSTDGNGSITRNRYDNNGNLASVTPPSPLGPTTYTHDSLGRVTSVTDGLGQKTQYLYDVMDRVVKVTYSDGSAVTTAYYPNGLRKTIDDSAAGVQTFEYDTSGSITKQTGPVPGVELRYRYDAAGNLVAATDQGGTTTYSYDAANNLAALVQSGGTCPASYDSPAAASSGCIRFKYDENGTEVMRKLPGNAAVATTIDGSGRPTRIVGTDAAGAARVDIAYAYSVAGGDRALMQQRTSRLEQGVTRGAVTTYGYDSQSRLVSAVERSGTATTASWTYAYDRAGNRTSQTRAGSTGASAGTTTYTYNAAGQLTATSADSTTWSYDRNGQQLRSGVTGQTSTYSNRTAASTHSTTTNAYFGDGNSHRTQSGGTTYTESALGLMRSSSTSAIDFTRTPTGSLVGYKRSDAHYYVTDALGSVVGLFSSAGVWSGGYSYSPYGEARSTGSATPVTVNPMRYIGGHLDASGLYKLGARYYDASTGRFTQMDPSGQESNLYLYAAGDPINASDPSGLMSWYRALMIVETVLFGGDIYMVLGGASSDAEGLSASFSLACGLVAGSIAAPTVAGVIVAAGGCWVLGKLVDNALAEDGVR